MNLLFIFYIILITIFLFLSYYLLIPYLQKLKFGQTVRELGPRNHQAKNGTPTLGGILIFNSFILTFISLLFVINKHHSLNFNLFNSLYLFIPLFGYYLIGLTDDLLIIWKKKNNGLNSNIKLILQLLISLIFYIFLINSNCDTTLNMFGFLVDIKYLYGLLIIIIFISSTNATNLTDGLDGLLTICSIPILIGYIIMSFIFHNQLALLLSLSLLIPLVVFLFFNFPKAKIFMGDTGSLFIGAFIALIPIILKSELILLICGLPFIIETLSVIIQVSYYKITKGKRIFKMAPYHHHLELCGLNDMKINIIFFVISSIGTIISLFLVGVYK